MSTKIKSFLRILETVIFTLLFTIFFSCGNRENLSESTAVDAIENYLKANPVYETTDLEIGEITFRGKRDADKLQAYKELASKSYIDFDLAKQKKQFLSKDSAYVYEVKLTDKSRPFVFKQKKDKAEVKTVEYQLDKKETPKIEPSGKRSANVTITLKKVKTDFASLTVDKNPNSSFITRTFKLRYDKERGWEVTRGK